MLRSLGREMNSASRSLRRSPGFVVLAAGTMAVGIAVNAAMFTLVNAIFFRPMPWQDVEQLYALRIDPRAEGRWEPMPLERVESALAAVTPVAGFLEQGFVVSVGGDPETVQGVSADARLFGILGATPLAGRSLADGDAVEGAAPVVVISEELWRTRLGGGGDVLGKVLRVDWVDRTIVGVMPWRFSFPDFARLWVPLGDRGARRVGEVQVLMRLRDEATRSRALAAVDAAVRQDGIAGAARADSLAPQGGPLLVLILCAIGFVLLIACTNVANVVLARGTGRRYELGVRAALGATRGQLFGYQIAEGTILAALAVGVGVLASAWLLDGLVALIPVDGLPSWLEFRMDARVLAWIGGTGITAVLVSAALPAWTLLRGAPGALVSDSGTRSIGDRGAGRLRSGLVAVQVALATVLLAGAALLVQTFTALRTVDPGYDAASVLEVPVRRPAEAPGFERLVEEGASSLRALPAAAEAAVAAPPLLRGQLEAPESGRRSFAMTESVSPEYPAALGLALERGRTFASWDEPGAILLSAALATALFDSPEAALGATVRFSGDGRRLTVIGIVADRFAPMGDGTEGTSPVPQAYLPLSLGDRAEPRFLIRASGGDVLALAAPAAAALRRLDPDASVGTTQTRQRIEQAGSGDDIVFFATVFTAFGAIALLLASLGIYGVVAFTASKRTREIGVRVALGANPRQVLALVLGGVAPAGGVGLGFGVAGAFGLGQGLRGVLYGVGPADPKTMIGLPVVFAIVTLIAALAPARRASRLDPLEALRAD